MNEDLNIIQSINQGADISINSKPTLDIVGSFDGGQNDWQSIPDSSFGSSDQVKFDNALYNNLDLIFHVLPGQVFKPTGIVSREQGGSFDLSFILGATGLTSLGNIYNLHQQVF